MEIFRFTVETGIDYDKNESSNNLSEIQAQWVTVRSKIRQKIGDAQFASWIKLLTLEDYSDQKVTLSVPSKLHKNKNN